jgi:hypothetical protein
MHPVLQILCLLAIFILPGLLIVAALGGGWKRIELTLGEQMYLVFAGSLLVSGWVGLVLAELGRFTPARVAAVVAGLVLAVAVGARRHLTWKRGRFGLDEAVVIVCLLGFALVVYFPPFEYNLGGKDPGVYVNTGFHLAREGNLRYVDPLILDIPEEARALFFRTGEDVAPWAQPRYLGFYMESPETGLVLPQGLHLYPLWMGMASGLFQMKSGLWVTPTFALCALAGLFLMLRRLFGVEVALWASGLLAVFQIQVWFSRFPTAEIMVQFLFVTGIFLFFLMEEHRSSLAGFLAGFAFGSAFLVRLDSVLFLIPIGLYFGWRRLNRQLGKPEVAFLVPFVLLIGHTAIHARLFSLPYVSNVFGRWYWRWIGENLGLIAVVVFGLFLVVDWLVPKLAARFLSLVGHRRTRTLLAASVFLLASYAYFIRPVWHGVRTAPHDAEAFFRMGWYLYPMGLGLAIGGAMVLLYRQERRSGLFILIGLTFSLFFFYKIRVWNDHYFCMRRFIPVILPCLFSCIAVFLVRLHHDAGRWGRWASGVIGVTVFAVFLVDGRPLWSHNEFRGSLRFVDELARHIGDRDVVIFPRREGLHLLELPLSQQYGKNVLEFYGHRPDKRLIEQLFSSWSGKYGDIYFITNYKISLSGFFTRHVADFALGTEKWEYTYTRPPKRSEPFHLRFTLSKAVDLEELSARMPPMSRIDVGGSSDEPLVAWFHEKDLEDGVSFRWSQATSSILLSGLGPESKELVVRLAGAKEEQAPAARVRISLNELSLAVLEPGSEFETFVLPLSDDLMSSLEGEYPILRLDSDTWRPANAIPGATDVRDLGVRVDWIEVQ